jgi:hypothetical protein
MMRKQLYDNFAQRIELDPQSGCWNWIGVRDEKGYGRIRHSGGWVNVHRWAYEFFVAPIPPGYHVDHLCHNTRCQNPLHLDAVTPAENRRRQTERSRQQRKMSKV